jgi:UDP-N-acetylglucosamine:LPS N-acetylglucosamine transferase
MGKRILIPYLSAGLGHMIQAQAIAHYLHRMRPDWDITIMDAARELDDALMQKTFVDAWRVFLRMPSFLSSTLFALEPLAPGLTRALNRRSFRTAVPKAAAYLAAHTPDLIMSTHWACGHLFSMAQGESRTPRIPHYYFYGELRATYSIINCGADLYFTLTQSIEEGLARLGVEPARMRRVPVVVDPHMVTSDVPRDVLRRGLGIPPESLAVVLSQGGEGIGRTLPFIEAFARDVKGATLVVLTARNTELLHQIQQRVTSDSVIAMGYQEDISGIYGAADILAGKCGTGYAMIAMATGIPLIVTHIGAPNERENMRHIVETGHGWFCPRPREFAEQVSMLVRDRAGCRESQGARSTLGRSPDRRAASDRENGAEVIAAAIVDTLA